MRSGEENFACYNKILNYVQLKEFLTTEVLPVFQNYTSVGMMPAISLEDVTTGFENKHFVLIDSLVDGYMEG